MNLSMSILAACFFAVCGAAMADCPRKTFPGANAPLSTTGNFNAQLLDRSILAEANYQRCRSGLPTLFPLTELRSPAQAHSNWMAKRNKLSHQSTVQGRKTLRDRVKSTGLATRTAAENLALLPLFDLTPRFHVIDRSSCRFTSTSGERLKPHTYESFSRAVVKMWMKSPGHRRNLMSNSVSHMAAAATLKAERKTCGTVYVTQLFVG